MRGCGEADFPPASSLEGWVGGTGGTGWADGDVIRVRWEAGVQGGVRASVRGQRGRGHGQAWEATGRLRPKCFCYFCSHCRRYLQWQRLYIRVASSSENLPLLIKRGGLKVGEKRTLWWEPLLQKSHDPAWRTRRAPNRLIGEFKS